MVSAKTCAFCKSFITCHGSGYRYISCKTCQPQETNICFDCCRNGHTCSEPDHEFLLTFHYLDTDQQHTQLLGRARDLLVIEAGCSESVDPLLALARPEKMPKDWFKCIYILPARNEFDLLECVLVDEQYPHNAMLDDMAVIHAPTPSPSETSYAILCNDELAEVSERLYHILSNLVEAINRVNAMQQEKGTRQTFFKRFWVAELCLSESLISSPPIPHEAICALAGRLTNNHIFYEGLKPQSDMCTSNVVKLLQLVKFDRFGTPVIHSHEAQRDTNATFHVRVLSEKQIAADSILFVDGLKQSVSSTFVSFFRTCVCEKDPHRDFSLYAYEARKRRVSSHCPMHGDTAFFIPEICLDSSDAVESFEIDDEQNKWNWIKKTALSHECVDDVRGDAYAPLEAEEIRLLRFFPLRLGRKGQVDVPMATITHPLDQAPSFVALSYCWGSSSRDCFLPMLTHETLRVTQHLGQIIRDLVNSNVTNVWIDQICIDQENLEEKADQVAHMLPIYKAADEVLIHLGKLSAPEKVGRFVKVVAPLCLEQTRTPSSPSIVVTEDDLRCWLAFREARSSPWFSRTWIIQEMSTNPRTSVLLGAERVSWDDFLAADLVTSDELFFSKVPPDIVGIHSMPVFARIREQQQQQGGYGAAKLFEILASTRFLGASDPKDKIYAFMGLFDHTSIRKWLPRPDYHRRVVDVYTSFAAAYALNGYTLHLLQLAGISQTSPENRSLLPSWVPDWSFGNVLLKSLRQNRAFEHGTDGFSSGTQFEASAGLETLSLEDDIPQAITRLGPDRPDHKIPYGDFTNPNQPRETGMNMSDQILLPLIHHMKADNGRIHARIALLGEVVGLTKLRLFEKFLQTQNPTEKLQQPREALLELNQEVLELVSAHMDAIDAPSRIARTMIADTWREKDSHDIADIHRQWLQSLQNAKDGVPSEGLDNSSPIWRYGGRVRQTLQDRVFGITKDHRLGIFPSATCLGDQIGIVAGLDLPSVFRRAEQGFALVGEAYVEGVMYGEFRETEEAKFQKLKIL